jgi:hypothetical protein
LQIDKLVLILSTDWFLPYWLEIGIDLTEDKKIAIQQGCREIVPQILGGSEDYFHSDHSSERKEETYSKFKALLRDLGADRDLSKIYLKWAALSHRELTASFSFAMTTRGLVYGPSDEESQNLNADTLTAIRETWTDSELNADACLVLCWKSMTCWDACTRNVLGSPTALSSTLKSIFRHDRFMAFSAQLRLRLTPEQREQLSLWYRETRNNRSRRVP